MIRYVLLSIFFLTFAHFESHGQISKKGNPPSFSNQSLTQDIPLVNLNVPEKPSVTSNKAFSKIEAIPFEIGYTIATDLKLSNSGIWTELANGDRLWRVSIGSDGAEAMNVYFTNFYLPDRCELYIYNKDRSMVLGAYTSENNPESGIFSTELLAGDQLTLELIVSKRSKEIASFSINEIGHIYQYSNFVNSNLKDLGDSGPCEVNINCLEGTNWQRQKRGVARIVVKRGNSISACTGTLLNNVNRDFTPYFYTAEHCGQGASATDYSNWVFYFNYEAQGCDNPNSEPNSNTLTGSELLSKISYTEGSDFKLLLLQNEVPPIYNPYFNGWSILDEPSLSGVSIHHPGGDIKKISTYTDPLLSTNYEGTEEDLNGSFWRVFWAETTNGHGITEGGSSGAPLFNAQGLVVGALTGGGASCSNLTAPDYFGKLAHSWDKFATDNSNQIKAYLDPDNTGITSINGLDYNDEFFIPAFKADTVTVPVGRPVNFSDLSVGNITGWNWTFEGAVQALFDIQYPQNIIYPNVGVYDVELEITNGVQTEKLLKQNYIKVVPLVTPVPASEQLTVYLGTKPVPDVEIVIFDESGRRVGVYNSADAIKRKVISVSEFRPGYYILKIQTHDFVQSHKIVVI